MAAEAKAKTFYESTRPERVNRKRGGCHGVAAAACPPSGHLLVCSGPKMHPHRSVHDTISLHLACSVVSGLNNLKFPPESPHCVIVLTRQPFQFIASPSLHFIPLFTYYFQAWAIHPPSGFSNNRDIKSRCTNCAEMDPSFGGHLCTLCGTAYNSI